MEDLESNRSGPFRFECYLLLAKRWPPRLLNSVRALVYHLDRASTNPNLESVTEVAHVVIRAKKMINQCRDNVKDGVIERLILDMPDYDVPVTSSMRLAVPSIDTLDSLKVKVINSFSCALTDINELDKILESILESTVICARCLGIRASIELRLVLSEERHKKWWGLAAGVYSLAPGVIMIFKGVLIYLGFKFLCVLWTIFMSYRVR